MRKIYLLISLWISAACMVQAQVPTCNTQALNVPTVLNVEANNAGVFHIELSQWKELSTKFTWTGDSALNMLMGNSCNFLPSQSDPNIVGAVTLQNGVGYTIAPKDWDKLTSKTDAEGKIYFRMLTAKKGVLKVEIVENEPVQEVIDWNQAVEFDFDNANQYPGDNNKKLFHVDLQQVESGKGLILFMQNLSQTQSTTLYVEGFLVSGGKVTYTMTEDMFLNAKQKRNFLLDADMVTMAKNSGAKIYIRLKANQPVECTTTEVTADTEDIDCLNAAEINWPTTNVPAGTKWYRIDLNGKLAANQALKITGQNVGNAMANVDLALSLNCPSTGLTTTKVSLQKGDLITKTLDNALIAMLNDSVAWIKVTTNQPLKLTLETEAYTPQTLNVTGTVINVVDGTWYSINANETKWFAIAKADFVKAGYKPVLTIENLTNTNANIEGNALLQRVGGEPISKALSLYAKQVLVKEIGANLISSMSSDTLFVQIQPTQNIQFQARLMGKKENQSCMSGRVFDWNNENLQQAGTETWWKVPIANAKANNTKDVKITVQNLAAQTNNVAVSFTFDCANSDPMGQTLTIPAGQQIQRVLDYPNYAYLANDTVYLLVNTQQNIKITATLVDRPVVPTDDACLTAIVAQVDTDIQIKGNMAEQWFKVNLQQFKDSTRVLPRITITNLSNNVANVTGAYTFECPAPQELTEQTLSIQPKEAYTKTITRDLVEAYDAQWAYLRIKSTDSLIVRVDFVDPNEGQDCSTAKWFNMHGNNIQEQNTVLWWKVPLAELKQDNLHNIQIHVENLGDAAAQVSGTIGFTCPSDGAMARTLTIPAHSTSGAELDYSMYAYLDGDFAYICLATNQQINIYTTLVDRPIEPADSACLQAILVQPKQLVTHTQPTAWYKIGVQPFRDSLQISNLLPRVIITNKSNQTNKIQGKLSFVCPTDGVLQDATISLQPNSEYTKMVPEDLITSLKNDIDTIYLQIQADAEITFIVDWVNPNEGQDCKHARYFNWYGNNIQEAGFPTWWQIPIEGIKDSTKYDLKIHIENLDPVASAHINATMKFDCEQEPVLQRPITLAAGSQIEQVLSYSSYATLASDIIYIYVTSDKKINIYAELVPREIITPDDACLQAIVAEAETDIKLNAFVSQWYKIGIEQFRQHLAVGELPKLTINNRGNIATHIELAYAPMCPVDYKMVTKEQTIDSMATWTYMGTQEMIDAIGADTVYFRLLSEQNIVFRVDWISENEGESCTEANMFNWYGDNFQQANQQTWWEVALDPMKDPNYDGVKIFIENLSQTDSATVKASLARWTCEDGLFINRYIDIPAGQISEFATTDLASVAIDTALLRINSNQDLRIYAVLIPLGEAEKDSACIDAMYVVPNTDYPQAAGTTQWYKFDVQQFRDSLTISNILPRIKVANQENVSTTLKSSFAFDCPSGMSLMVQSAEVQAGDTAIKTISKDLIESLDSSVDTMFVRLYAEGDVILRVDWHDPRIDTVHVYDSICYGDSIMFGSKALYTTGTYVDTLTNLTTGDSIVYMHLMVANPTIQMPIDTIAVMRGESYLWHTWQDVTINQAGLHYDTAYNSFNCDSVYYALHLVYNDSVVLYDTLCYGDSLWFGDEYLYTSGLYIDSLTNETQGDSIVYLHLLVADQPVTMPTDSVALMRGETYVWHTWQDVTINQAGLHYDTAYNSFNCDSVYYSLRLVYNDSVVLCDTLCYGDSLWFGDEYLYTSGLYIDSLTNETQGDSIVYLHLLVADQPVTMPTDSVALMRGETYVWHTWQDVTINQAGLHYDTAYNSFNCDSVYYTLHLVYNDSVVLYDTLCYGDSIWFGDEYLYTSGLYIDSLTNETQGDSIVYLNLLVADQPLVMTQTDAFCKGTTYTWHTYKDIVLSQAGTYNDTAYNSFGCDSVYYELVLTENPTYNKTTVKTICESELPYLFADTTFNTVGVHTYSYYTTTILGCDSVEHIQLTVLPIYRDTLYATTCDNQPYEWVGHNLTFTQAGIYADTLTAASTNCDSICVLNLTVYPTAASEFDYTMCEGDSMTIDSISWYKTTGDYAATLKTIHGCDSVVTVHLTVKPLYRDTTKGAICQGEVFMWKGKPYNIQGTYYDTLPALTDVECDSIQVLQLTVHPTFKETLQTAICPGELYYWRGNNYSKEGIYYDSLQTINGCDSIYELQLTFNPVYNDTVDMQICRGDSLLFDNEWIKNSGVYTKPLTSIYGCDSIVTWNVTMLRTFTSSYSMEICQGETIKFGNQTISQVGVYVDTLTAINGCDSIVTLNLVNVIQPVYAPVETINMCNGAPYSWRGVEYKQSGTYYDTIQSFVTGCDSIMTLKLTITPKYEFVDSAQICNGVTYTWRGKQLTQTGYYVDSLTTTTGCDSVYALKLVVYNSIYQEDSATICEGETFNWRGKDYTKAGTYTDKVATQTGCDDVYVLKLNVTPKRYGKQELDVCVGDSVMYNNEWFTAGTHTVILTSQLGCDSVVTLKVNQLPQLTGEDFATICANETYQWYGQSITKAGDYQTKVKSAVTGCDSIITLHVSVIDTTHTIVFDTVCPDESLLFYYDTLQSVLGCDSIIEHHPVHAQVPQMPDLQELDALPQLVCGETVRLIEADAAVQDYISNMNNDNIMLIESFEWEQQDSVGNFKPLAVDHKVKANDEGIVIRLKIETSCGVYYSQPTTIHVEMPSTDNTDTYKQLPALSKYDGWMIMLDINAIQNMGYNPKPEDVVWYRIVGEPDPIANIVDDVPVGYGFYYSENDRLTGGYYAIVTMITPVNNGCDIIFRSDYIMSMLPQHKISIQPTQIESGEPIKVIELNPEETTTLKMYDAVGHLMGVETVTGSSIFTIHPHGPAGTYFLHVTTQSSNETFMYMITK